MTMVSIDVRNGGSSLSLKFAGFPDAATRSAKNRAAARVVVCGTGFEPADPYGTAS